MTITLPTFEECDAIERGDRTPLEAFIWEHEPSDQVSLDEFRKLLGAVIEAERAQVEALREALEDAIDCVRHWGGYADSYFKEKHDIAGDVARLRAALAKVPR